MRIRRRNYNRFSWVNFPKGRTAEVRTLNKNSIQNQGERVLARLVHASANSIFDFFVFLPPFGD